MRNFTLILIAGAATAASACVALADSTPAASPTPAVAATTPAPATTPVAPTTSTTAAATDDNEIICKSSGPPTGSRLGSHRECKTKHDWDADRVRSEQDLSRFQDVHAGVGMGGH
jgi:hypothetical protein